MHRVHGSKYSCPNRLRVPIPLFSLMFMEAVYWISMATVLFPGNILFIELVATADPAKDSMKS